MFNLILNNKTRDTLPSSITPYCFLVYCLNIFKESVDCSYPNDHTKTGLDLREVVLSLIMKTKHGFVVFTVI